MSVTVHIASFRCGAEFGRYRGTADIGHARNKRARSMSTRPSQVPSRLSLLNHRQLAVDYQQHAVEFVAAAQDQPARRDHAVDPLGAKIRKSATLARLRGLAGF